MSPGRRADEAPQEQGEGAGHGAQAARWSVHGDHSCVHCGSGGLPQEVTIVHPLVANLKAARDVHPHGVPCSACSASDRCAGRVARPAAQRADLAAQRGRAAITPATASRSNAIGGIVRVSHVVVSAVRSTGGPRARRRRPPPFG